MWFFKSDRMKALERENSEQKERIARLEQMVQDREQYVMKTARELEEYRRQDAYLGAIVGRCANRIGGAGFVLDGRAVRLTPNEGANQLHGGLEGFSHKVWDYSY